MIFQCAPARSGAVLGPGLREGAAASRCFLSAPRGRDLTWKVRWEAGAPSSAPGRAGARGPAGGAAAPAERPGPGTPAVPSARTRGAGSGVTAGAALCASPASPQRGAGPGSTAGGIARHRGWGQAHPSGLSGPRGHLAPGAPSRRGEEATSPGAAGPVDAPRPRAFSRRRMCPLSAPHGTPESVQLND